jgi:hypothetical protein
MLGAFFVLFILVVGVAAVAVASSFAINPRERTLAVLRPLTASTAFATVSAVLAGIAMALKNGAAESAVPGVLGFALLAVAWLLAALGFRRQT